ncbi:FtsW/RodA/SpoVE family cell cycle protein [Sulfuricurvum sp.]|uniref:FtsW/RodA/SpoVE family cell cycle protein n=1 Tax=Sulfuricurvum sp. TaxID=2025608 RepID=UPI002632E86B|nr:FtsW/RodA/SpoVE family cell cycle protein [Sulfuricurvum sp.]MDD3594863.1 FtsW/RodA/SpoVE family cell cycle protein [Sulfuricurvum sp.]
MPDKKLFLITTILITIGIICSYTLGTYAIIRFEYEPYHFVLREFVVAMASIIVMWVIAQLDPDVWLHRLGLGLFIMGIVLMAVMPFLPESLVSEVGGAKRWIKLPGFSLAPVEFFKIGFVYFLAWSFSRKFTPHNGISIKEEFIRFLPYAFLFLLAVFLIAFLQNDLGQVVVLAATLAVLLLFAGSSGLFFGYLIIGSGMIFSVIIFSSENRMNRIAAWWQGIQSKLNAIAPDLVSSQPNAEEPYQIGHSLNAINNGGLFGSGLGSGTFKLGFLSEVHTDFVLAGIAEEFGFIGVLVVTMLFAALLFRIFKISGRSINNTYYLFSMGVGLLITFAFMINAYGISGIIPIKGISIPFLSYGGSAMLASSIAIGMVIMISKRASAVPLEYELE